MKNLLDWIKAKTSGWGLSATFAIMLLALLCLNGCSLQELVKVATPQPVLDATGWSGDVNLANVDVVWNEWSSFVDRNSNAFEAATVQSRERLELLESLTDLGLGALTSSIPGGAPLGGLALGALSMLTGLFLKRPGTDKVIAREKENSYNAGIAVGSSVSGSD